MGPTAQFSLPKLFSFFSFWLFLCFCFFLNHSKWSGENSYMCSLKQQQTSVSHFSCLYCKENIVSVTGSHKSHTRALRERREVSEKRRPRHVHNLRYFEYPKTSRSFSTRFFCPTESCSLKLGWWHSVKRDWTQNLAWSWAERSEDKYSPRLRAVW